MPFRCRQKLKLAINTGHVYDLEEKVLESGAIIKEYVDQSAKKLPDPELFELKNQLDAGVDMEEVNPTLFMPKHVDGDRIVRKYTKKKETKNVDTDN